MFIPLKFLSRINSYNPVCVPLKFSFFPPNPMITRKIPLLHFACRILHFTCRITVFEDFFTFNLYLDEDEEEKGEAKHE